MEYETLKINTLIAWLIDRLIVFFICLFFSIFIYNYLICGTLIALILIAINVYMLYYATISIFFEKAKWRFKYDETKILILCGFMYIKSTFIPMQNVQDLVFYQTPIQKLFHVGRLVIYTAGSKHKIKGIDKHHYETLYSHMR